jgi:kynureninase
MQFENTPAFAEQLDAADELRHFRNKFYIPIINDNESVYFMGNSLGLQPRSTQDYIADELETWANYGVEGHFFAPEPWYTSHQKFTPLLAPIIGALEEEIAVMNQLTVNLHLLMGSFYRPTQQRYKIICEAKAFPSDQYVFESQVKLHGFDTNAIIEVAQDEGCNHISTQKILDCIAQHGSETALVLFSGINYYNGQLFDMAAITKAAHQAGAYCGFDLAHAIGNVPLQLHNWGADFACWCSYKYLNSGPGGISGVFIHQRHTQNTQLPRLAGWWGYDRENRFGMEKGFVPMPTAEGWQVSCYPVLLMAAHKASLDLFAEAGMPRIMAKAKLLKDYLWYIIEQVNASFTEPFITVITPQDARGSQISMQMKSHGKEIFEALKLNGIIGDWREPNAIRVAPVPLYNNFTEVLFFGQILGKIIEQLTNEPTQAQA